MPIGFLLVLIYFFEEKKNAFGTGFGWALMGLYLPTVLKLFAVWLWLDALRMF